MGVLYLYGVRRVTWCTGSEGWRHKRSCPMRAVGRWGVYGMDGPANKKQVVWAKLETLVRQQRWTSLRTDYNIRCQSVLEYTRGRCSNNIKETWVTLRQNQAMYASVCSLNIRRLSCNTVNPREVARLVRWSQKTCSYLRVGKMYPCY